MTDLETWGPDATKVGVGPGKVCITKLKTGFATGGWPCHSEVAADRPPFRVLAAGSTAHHRWPLMTPATARITTQFARATQKAAHAQHVRLGPCQHPALAHRPAL